MYALTGMRVIDIHIFAIIFFEEKRSSYGLLWWYIDVSDLLFHNILVLEITTIFSFDLTCISHRFKVVGLLNSHCKSLDRFIELNQYLMFSPFMERLDL